MKKLFIMLAAAATVASCANEETVMEAPGQAIEFGSFVDNATRADAATDPSYSTTGKGKALTEFNVYGAVGGVNIFNGDKVVKGNAAYGNAWALEDPNQKTYWIDGASYEFVAVVDGNKKDANDNVITETTIDASGIPTSIAYNSDGATDLLCARVIRNAVDGVTDKSLVFFGFTHLLSKVKFSVENETPTTATNYRIMLTEAKITGALASDSYIVANGAWDTTNAVTTKDFTLEDLIVNSGDTQYHSTELLLLPGVEVGVYVAADIQATDDNGQTWETVSNIEKTFTNVVELVKGNAYHFAVELGIGTEIQFTASTMPEWGNGNTDDTNSDSTNDAVVLE